MIISPISIIFTLHNIFLHICLKVDSILNNCFLLVPFFVRKIATTPIDDHDGQIENEQNYSSSECWVLVTDMESSTINYLVYHCWRAVVVLHHLFNAHLIFVESLSFQIDSEIISLSCVRLLSFTYLVSLSDISLLVLQRCGLLSCFIVESLWFLVNFFKYLILCLLRIKEVL